MNKDVLIGFSFFIVLCAIKIDRVYAQIGMPVVYVDSFSQSIKTIRYNDEITGVQLVLLRTADNDSFILIVKNLSRNNICYLRTVENSRSNEYYSLGGLPPHSQSSDSVFQLHILSTGKFDSLKIAWGNGDIYKIYLDLYLIPQGLLDILNEEGLKKIAIRNGKTSILLRASLIDSLNGTEDIYRMIKISPVYRDMRSGRFVVISTMKYRESNYTYASFLTRNQIKSKVEPVEHVLLDSVRCVAVDHSIVYKDKRKNYIIRIRKEIENGANVKLSIRNTSNSAMGIIPPKSLIANEYCEWTVGSYLILSGCYDALIIRKMLYLAPGEGIDYVVNVGSCSLYNFYIDLCLDADRIASDESGKKPTLELKDGKNYVEVPYSNSILKTPDLFHSISIQKIGRDVGKSKPVVKVKGYQ